MFYTDGFGGLKRRAIAKRLEHETDNPGHDVSFSFETELFECDSCDYTYASRYTEKEIENMVAGEFENTCSSRYYEFEVGAIWEANFHHEMSS